ncbi:MAG TPA: hypothetical protein VGO93_01815 [Candidatus Xenobia bacterium]
MVEVLVTAALLLMLVGLTLQVLRPSLHLWAVNQAQASIEDMAMVLETRMGREMERTHQATVTATVPPPGVPGLMAISFATFEEDSWRGWEDSLDDYCACTGRPRWQGFVVYFLPSGSHTVYRKVWPVAPFTNPQVPAEGVAAGQLNYNFPIPQGVPKPLRAADLVTLCDTVNGTEIQVAGGVDRMQLDILPAQKKCGSVVSTATNAVLTLTLSAPAPTRTNRVVTTRSQQIFMRQ